MRSTDLLSLPNINPDAGFGLQVSIDENLSEVQNICFQAALLYTSSKGNVSLLLSFIHSNELYHVRNRRATYTSTHDVFAYR